MRAPSSDGIRRDLLQPSLSGPAAIRAAPYSEQTGLLTAFIGGPVAITALFGINAYRTGRLARDAVWIAAMTAIYLAWLYLAIVSPAGAGIQRALVDLVGARGPVLFETLMALLFMAAAYLLHRGEQRSAELFSLRRPNGLLAGVALIAAGLVVSGALRVALRSVH